MTMMLSILDSDKNGSEESENGKLLRDIETISKALYLHNTLPLKSLISTSVNRPKSKLKTKDEDVSHKDKKSSMWNWKNPLKALSHIRNQKFNCCFYLHVHSIEGLPSDFDKIGLSVNWKRKDEVLRTCPVRIDQGIAEFEETLTCPCSVYGHKSGPENSAKYEAMLSLVYPSFVGGMDLDIGKHWIDLTKILPLTLEDLEEEKCSGKWTTSFQLIGKAKGATLNVSLGFSVMGKSSIQTESNMKIVYPSNSNLEKFSGKQNIVGFGHGKLRRVGSVSNIATNYWSHFSPQSTNIKGLKLSRSINNIYKELEAKFDNECDDIVFDVIDKGIELSFKEESNFKENSGANDDVASNEGANENSKNDYFILQSKDVVVNGREYKEDDAYVKESTMENLTLGENSTYKVHIEENDNYIEEKSSYKRSKMIKSLSLDDIESITSDFLNSLHVDHNPFSLSSDSDPESPRERLLRQFENDFFEDLDKSMNNKAFEQNEKREKRKAKVVEILETESLMRESGFNEKIFQNSPRYSSGFGSPI